MEQSVREYVTEKVKALISAPSCCDQAKAAGENWLKAAGTDQEAEQTKNLIAELEMDIDRFCRIRSRGKSFRTGQGKRGRGSRKRA